MKFGLLALCMHICNTPATSVIHSRVSKILRFTRKIQRCSYPAHSSRNRCQLVEDFSVLAFVYAYVNTILEGCFLYAVSCTQGGSASFIHCGLVTTYEKRRSGHNSSPPSAAYTCMRQWTGTILVQVMACRLCGAKPLPEPKLAYCQLDSWNWLVAWH